MERAYEAAYFEQRFRNRIYEAVIKAVEESAMANKWKRKDLAKRSGKKASQISKWLSGPSNWTLDTVSDLLFAIDAELDFVVTPFVRKNKSNQFHSLNNPLLSNPTIESPPQSPISQATPEQAAKSQFPIFGGTS